MSGKTCDREAAGLPDDERFLRRWSRRKRAAAVGEAPDAPPAPAETKNPPPAPVLTDADMPPIESLTPDSDFTGFMSPGVSEALRERALRVLFRSPSLNVRCPLDSEYYDCANTTPLGSIITHDMREEMEREARKRLAAIGREARERRPAGDDATDDGTTNEGGQRDA